MYSVTLSRCVELWTRTLCWSQLQNMHFNRPQLLFFHPLPSRTLAPLVRNMTTSNPVLFAPGHLDAGISAKHMLHGKQPQCSTEQDNKTQPRAEAFPPKSKCCSQPRVPSERGSRSSLLFCSWRSSKSPLNTMKRSDSLQIQSECLGTVGPHNRRGRASY